MSKAKVVSFICAIGFLLAACSGGGGSSGGGFTTGSGGGGTPGNNAPVFTSTAPTNAVEAVQYTYQATATDADGDLLSWVLVTSPAGMTVNASGLVTWTPSAAQVGSHSVQLDVSDGMVPVSQNWTINVTAAGGPNQPPVITSSAPTSATEGQNYSYAAAANDPNGDPLTWSLTTNPTGMTVGSSTGQVQWTPTTAQVGNHNVTLEVSDGQVSASQSWTITVSPASTGGGTATGGTGGSTGTVNGSYQGRSYRLHVPSSYSQSTPSPLVIALHGLGDTYTNFHNTLAGSGWTSAANSNNFILMTPQHMNSSRASFLHLSGTSLDQQGTQNELAGVILAAYYGAGATHNIETEEIYVIGFSEGAVATDLVGVWFSSEVRAIAPYAGGVTSKPFPAPRDIPVYGICGTADSGYTGAQQALAEWTTNSHTTTNAWVSGVGHSFSTLCSSGPSPTSVYQWLSTASFSTPVTSAWQSQGGGSTGSNPSGGTGGATPGNQSRTVTVSGLGSHTYYLYIPSSYNPSTPVPVMFAFHGAGGTGTAPAAAQAARNDWSSVANSEGFIVVAQAATGSGGGWLASNDSAILNEIITDVFGAYNIEQNRVYAWGFSAGGHFLHALALQNSTFFAGYGVSAGALQALAGTSAPAAATRKIPVHLYIGSNDTVVPPSAVQSDRNNFQANGWTLGTNLWYTEFSGGHTYSTSHLSDIYNNLKNHSLP